MESRGSNHDTRTLLANQITAIEVRNSSNFVFRPSDSRPSKNHSIQTEQKSVSCLANHDDPLLRTDNSEIAELQASPVKANHIPKQLLRTFQNSRATQNNDDLKPVMLESETNKVLNSKQIKFREFKLTSSPIKDAGNARHLTIQDNSIKKQHSVSIEKQK